MSRSGYASERTSLSWNRTAVSFAAVSGLLAKVGITDGRWWDLAAGAIAALGAAIAWLVAGVYPAGNRVRVTPVRLIFGLVLMLTATAATALVI